MFTIKHVTSSGETIYLGSEVMYHNGMELAAPEQVMYLDNKEWKSLRFGVVYVMNDAGKTVATYNMNAGRGIQTAAGSIVGPDDPHVAGIVGSALGRAA